MAIDTSGEYWRGADLADLAEYLGEFRAGGYPVGHVVESVCAGCHGRAFRLSADDDAGCAERVCVNCGVAAFLADSAEHADDADLEVCECPCGADTFAVALGLAYRSDQEVRWISIGLRCLTDGTLGVYADWKIDYSPTGHLLTSA
ncbi:hypothetical protein AB0C07_24070 [Actinoplanes missouriensis]|uniref:hypothetical protein n=1 Tax=Actinoplanes missouriensis TaxID=1866 RepID=UPI003405AF7A